MATESLSREGRRHSFLKTGPATFELEELLAEETVVATVDAIIRQAEFGSRSQLVNSYDAQTGDVLCADAASLNKWLKDGSPSAGDCSESEA